ncbi:MAG TPA: 2-oxoacid:ferredoxin oxidoreductase subunit beta [Chloroflexota bacterium]|nr:2-oxoacid:ferredoxin oxidoreductase subunit beta [Chloroflexota bacterium]
MSDLKLFNTTEKSTWCPGCGDFGILAGIKAALAGLDMYPHQAILVSGIGCGSKLPHYMHVNGYNSIHGRALPVAQGLKLANHELKVIAVTGDGDGYGIGQGHFIHAMRRNPAIVHVVENNQVYGLTKGQYSPTSEKGYISSFSPEGAIEFAINPLALALAAGATFVSRTFAGDVKQMGVVLQKAIQHRGYALVDCMQPCVTYNKLNTYDWFRARVYKLEEEEGYDPSSRDMAWQKAQEWGDRIPIGILYQTEDRPTYEEQVSELQAGPLVRQPMNGRVNDYEALKLEFV